MISDMQEFYDGYEAFQTKKLLQNEERESMRHGFRILFKRGGRNSCCNRGRK